MSSRILVLGALLGLGLEAWRGWAKTAGTPLPVPWLFTSWIVVVLILAVLATFAEPLAAVLMVGLLVALALGATNPLLATPAKAAA